MKIKISKLDKLFSDLIRRRDDWRCRKCKRQHDSEDSYSRMGLHCSHFFGRSNKGTRFDPLNCLSLCMGCHLYFHAHPIEHTEWFKSQITEKEFDELNRKARAAVKIDLEEIREWIKQELKLLEAREALND